MSHRRIDYKKVDFGYKNKAIPNIPGIRNEFGKLDIASFLNDQQDMMRIDDHNGVPTSSEDLLENEHGLSSARLAQGLSEEQLGIEKTMEGGDHGMGSMPALDLGKVY